MPKFGGKKLYYSLVNSETKSFMTGIGRDKFFEILRDYNLLVRRSRAYGIPGTDSSKTKSAYSNLKKNRVLTKPNELFESDMTAIRIKDSYHPLAICIDVYSRKVVGWHLSENWTTEETIKALEQAQQHCGRKLRGSIHHSDQGSVYASGEYGKLCNKYGMQQSMSRRAKPTDAAHIERLNRTLKHEFNLRRKFDSFEEANEAIYFSILIYNEIRPHWSLGLKTPATVYEQELKKNQPNPFRATPSRG